MNATEQSMIATAAVMVLRFGKGRKMNTANVATLNEASALWRAYLDANDLGASDGHQAYIFVDGIRRAKVSYNGKVFTMGGEKVFDPYAAEVA